MSFFLDIILAQTVAGLSSMNLHVATWFTKLS